MSLNDLDKVEINKYNIFGMVNDENRQFWMVSIINIFNEVFSEEIKIVVILVMGMIYCGQVYNEVGRFEGSEGWSRESLC